MKTYKAQSGDTFTSIAQANNVENGHLLRIYHNLNCPEEDINCWKRDYDSR